ncbi:hypothetical protein PC9H_002691 [Pleurotus ostreatus]|uniref:Uncharacterized protein n=3 Tax=Pleurotus TaxID=5320 RepID=A0A067NFR5_PLEO1|nr:uncharacterized protein PC9H_002691 [Pleurotus ostreatus]KAF7416425.1 hypothetical protein PC9H_002691 [Pleurotus ostreatus]KAG9225321.1 hypothetical protein CCMSSC00406_0006292 [Pleurotus cornucopiae]KAJ8689342.1 hypothetical protein PTI98_013371 [Pleurotus ostreatus]KDQ22952.1 hypothetical protein PLEOSDRAFT_1114759 [Pleurotus ostreatus PC15]
MAQLPLDKTFLLAAWLESLAYGFFLCLFCGTMLFTFGSGHRSDVHSRVMVGISCVMFFISTWHLAMNGYRLLQGFAVHVGDRGGAVGYIGNLRRWDHVLKDTLYATQEILGNAAGIYRCFILWNSDWRVIVLPLMLMVGSLVSGYTVCALFVQVDPTQSVFTNRLNSWIQAFYSIAVVQNVITTGLMAFRIWRTSTKSAKYKTENALLPIVRILIESAALQLIVEILLLALYSRSVNAQYILLELVTPTVGITFNAITIRIKLRAINNSAVTSEYSRSEPVQTIGSMPMRRIKVDITTQVEDDTDGKESSNSKLSRA